MLLSSLEIIEYMRNHDKDSERDEYVKSFYPEGVVVWK